MISTQKQRFLVKAVSPQNSFGSHKIRMVKNVSMKDISLKERKRNDVPKFLHKNKQKT